ncbi:MAG TPA: DMT family transporter [Ilumatobacter sp.]|nr:DMT family transporter [Ilumatobacter sp.]
MATSPATLDSVPSPHPAGHRRAIAAALLVTLLWSSSWVLIRVGLDDDQLPPVTFAALRYMAAALVLWAVVAARRVPVRTPGWSARELAGLAVLGVVFYTVTQGAQFVAIAHQPAATSSLVLSLTPLVVALVGAVLLGERPTRAQLVGGCVVAAGAAVYFAGSLGATRVGIVAVTIALCANVAGSVLGRHVNRGTGRPALVVTAISMSVGALLLGAVGLAAEDLPRLSARAIVIVVWLAVVNTALAFTLWNHALRRLTAVESAGINNLMLIQIAGLAWVFLDEPLGAAGALGVVLVSVGVYLTQRRRRG